MSCRIAICFSGQLRSIDKSIDYWKNIIEKYNIDVYGSFWESDVESKNIFGTLNPKFVEYEKYDFFKPTIDVFNQELKVPEFSQVFLGLANDTPSYVLKNNILSMWYKVWRSNMMSKIEKYDIVIRSRTDIYFDVLYIEKNSFLNLPWGWRMNQDWLNCGGPIDMFAYGSSEIMDYYSSLFLYLTRLLSEGNYYFPAEHILKSHLSQRDLGIRILPVRLFLSKDNSCFNNAFGVDNEEFKNSREWKCELDPTFSFYKKHDSI